MNRVPFDKLLRGVQDSRDPSSQLGMFGSSEKLKRIEKLEASMSLMAHEMQMYRAKVDEMGGDLGNDGMAINKLKADMQGKASFKDLQQAKQESLNRDLAGMHEIMTKMKRLEAYVSPLPQAMQEMRQRQSVLYQGNAHQMDSIIWLKDAVRALRDNHPLPPYPHEYKQSLPDKRSAVVPYKPENKVVPYTRWPPKRDAPLYNGYPGRDLDEE